MSRIGKLPVSVPGTVKIKLDSGNLITVTGPKGELSRQLAEEMRITVDESSVMVERPSDLKRFRALHGLTRTLINNMVIGVTEGYTVRLEINGVGYRAAKNGNKLVLTVGYSHPVEMVDPDGINSEVDGTNKIIVTGIDKEKVGQYAANIREKRPPEPFKGKGIRYEGEYVRKKAGKAGKK
jgi:large subunit ribosomal protein L6